MEQPAKCSEGASQPDTKARQGQVDRTASAKALEQGMW